MSALDFVGTIVGMPQQEVADVKASLPVISSIVDEAEGLEPLLEKMRPHIEAMVPMLKEAWPEIVKMWPQVVLVTPVIKEVADFIKAKV